MESLVMTWRVLVLISVFVFPHLLGILLYYRLHRAPRWVAVTVGVLAPAIIFFWLAPFLFFAGIREATARGEMNCGMPAVFIGFFLLAGTVIQLVLGLVTHAVWRHRK